MEDTFNYKLVPYKFVHCFNADCPHGESCLRRLAALHTSAETPYVMAVHPAAYPQRDTPCPHFRKIEKIRLAWGVSAILDNIPYQKAVMLSRWLHGLYPKTTYYRIKNKERALSPEEQQNIAYKFAQSGVEAPPVFDSYTEEYNWGDVMPPWKTQQRNSLAD